VEEDYYMSTEPQATRLPGRNLRVRLARVGTFVAASLCSLLVTNVASAGIAQTYYVGDSAGACGTVHYYGSSNGISHTTTENAERNCARGCLDEYLNYSGGGGQIPGTFDGICNASAGYLVIWQGSAYGTAWCDGHPESDFYTDNSGRCEYKYQF
jgi:hypothetical protein